MISEGTCCDHAVVQVIVESLRLKYAVAIPLEKAVTVAKTLCPCWAGAEVEQFCQEWNESDAPLESMGNEFVYRTSINCEQIELSRLVKTSTNERGLHVLLWSMTYSNATQT